LELLAEEKKYRCQNITVCFVYPQVRFNIWRR